MFSKLFRVCRDDSHSSSSEKLKQTLKILEEKEAVLQKKISQEVDRAKGFTRANNKQAKNMVHQHAKVSYNTSKIHAEPTSAIECLKRKKYYEGKMDQVGTFQLHIRNQEKKLQQDCHPT
ncbi:vacuolar protein sorting-associated protein 32 homolog 2 isoform X2 [Musa acuminata AAA Group]|uniref:vacuolar protein sorting-associated protein 32 homolog 2 isoform X2 n=1 Tax=Musa acuminata AAA Group TaxID=214697 RepID=UPI0031E2078F